MENSGAKKRDWGDHMLTAPMLHTSERDKEIISAVGTLNCVRIFDEIGREGGHTRTEMGYKVGPRLREPTPPPGSL